MQLSKVSAMYNITFNSQLLILWYNSTRIDQSTSWTSRCVDMLCILRTLLLAKNLHLSHHLSNILSFHSLSTLMRMLAIFQVMVMMMWLNQLRNTIWSILHFSLKAYVFLKSYHNHSPLHKMFKWRVVQCNVHLLPQMIKLLLCRYWNFCTNYIEPHYLSVSVTAYTSLSRPVSTS